VAAATVIRSEGHHREELGFWGEPGQRVFAAVTTPAVPPSGIAVLCPSLFSEHLAGYPQDVWLAEALAGAGLVSARLHYRGTGHSDGEAGDLDLDTMVEDVLATAARLAGDGVPVVLVGTRLGALVAAGASTALGGAPVVLVEPCLDAGRFLAEVLRVRRMREVLAGVARPVVAAEMVADLERGQVVDALGFPATARWWQSFAGRPLDTLLGDEPRPAYVVVPPSGARGDVEALAQGRADRGWPVEAVAAWDPHDWWLMKPRPAPDEERLGAVVAWMAAAVAA
jgi:hypothetical protein